MMAQFSAIPCRGSLISLTSSRTAGCRAG